MNRRKVVLIIDDEIDLSLLLKSYFLRKNFEVFLSHSVEDGMRKIDEVKPDILFLDNNLPDGEGWRVAPEICRLHPEIQLNLISAYHPQLPDLPEDAHVRLIEKPIRLSDLDKEFEDNNIQTEIPEQ